MPMAADIMTSSPITVDTMATVADAIGVMHDEDVRHLPVINEAGELVGVVSDRDTRALVLSFGSTGAQVLALDKPVSDMMSSDILTCTPSMDVEDVVHLFLDHRVGAIPVVDEREGTLVGIVSYMDLLRTMV